ncbi:MAG: PKD domain-containing protein [Thermoplasmata archaeon]|nr:PKD domain-containing protein [Thermoplasmata archaeon]
MAGAIPRTLSVLLIWSSVAVLLLSPGTLPVNHGGSAPLSVGTSPPTAASPPSAEALPSAALPLPCLPESANPECAFPDAAPSVLPSPTWVLRDAEIGHLAIYPGSMAFDPAMGETVEFDGLHASTWAYTGAGWNNITPPTSPSPRAYAGLAYDSDAQELVLFGGAAIPSGERLNDTWTFHAGTWTNVTSASDPPPNALFGLASDPRDNGVVLYGGYSDNAADSASNSTWLFTGSVWRLVTTSTATPPPSFAPGFAYDSVDRVDVLFGGTDIESGVAIYSNQTWTFAGGNWTNRTVSGPSPRVSPSLSDDAAVGGVLLFGGAGPGTTPAYGNDTWLFHGGRWSRTALGGPSPSVREAAGLDWDTAAGLGVLSGGVGPDGLFGTEFQPDTWTFQGDAWSEIQSNYTPAPRFGEGFAATLGAPTSAVLFGGLNATGAPINDTWEFSRDSWQERIVPRTPPGRAEAMMANDPPDDYQVLFGGASPNGTPTNDTWTFDGTAWTNRTTSIAPTPRVGGSFVYDPTLGLDILFGGRNAANATLNDTWSYSGGNWTRLAPANSPTNRTFASATFDPVLGGIVLFGGSTDGADPGAGMQNDTWLFANGTWRTLPSVGAPPPRYGASMDFDVRLQSLVVFGGWVVPNPPYETNDTWTYSSTGWRILTVHAAPPTLGFTDSWWDARTNTTWIHGGAAYDAHNGVVVLGGETEALDLLRANASTSGTSGLTPFPLQVNASARDGEGPYHYVWTVAGQNSTTANTTFLINTVGTYTIDLNITDAWGVAWQASFPLTTTPGPIRASFVATPNQGSAPLVVQFAATALGGTPPYSYAWNFDDGSTQSASADPNASHTFRQNRTFNVVLTVAPATGANTTATEPVELQSFAFPTTFNVTASVSPSVGTGPLNVTYAAAATNGTPGYSFAWAFGDGGTSTAASGFHTYTNPGEFTVGLNVTDSNGVVVAKTFQVQVAVSELVGPIKSVGHGSTTGFEGLPWWAWAVIVGLSVAVLLAAILLVRRGRTPPGAEGTPPTTIIVRPMPWDESDDAGR